MSQINSVVPRSTLQCTSCALEISTPKHQVFQPFEITLLCPQCQNKTLQPLWKVGREQVVEVMPLKVYFRHITKYLDGGKTTAYRCTSTTCQIKCEVHFDQSGVPISFPCCSDFTTEDTFTREVPDFQIVREIAAEMGLE